MMVIETWVVLGLGFLEKGGGDGSIKLPDTDFMSNFRLLKLARIARMARLLRSAPELLVMIKALSIALRSVAFAFILLGFLIYVFAILFTQLLKDPEHDDIRVAGGFQNVPDSFLTLLTQGCFPDNTDVIYAIGRYNDDERQGIANFLMCAFMVIYLILCSLTILNMLVGILCDVVSEVSDFEREEMLLLYVRETLEALLTKLGLDVSEDEGKKDSISRESFEDLLEKPEAIKVLHKVGVDVFALVDQTDFIFENDRKALNFGDFFAVIMKLRGSNTATVKDMVDMRKLINTEISRMNDTLIKVTREEIDTMNRSLSRSVRATIMESHTSKDHRRVPRTSKDHRSGSNLMNLTDST
jgi:hypothetical protein